MKSVFVHRRGAGFFRTGPADGFGEGLPSAHVTEAAGALRMQVYHVSGGRVVEV